MTIVLDLSKELEERLRLVAQQEGLGVERYLLDLAEDASAARRSVSGYGRFAHVNTTAEDLRRERQEDNRRENRA